MNFDFSTDTIIPDISGILTISGTGALEIPVGTTAQRPGSPTEGWIRFNSDTNTFEAYTTTWGTVPSGSSAFVASFQTSLSGLTPSSATTGAVTLAGTLGISSGGTGQTTQTAAFDALSPLTTAGDILFYNGTHNVRLAVGTPGQVLTVSSGEPAWVTSSTSFPQIMAYIEQRV